MEEPFLTYSLSFRRACRNRKPPELVITLRDDVLEHAEHLLRTTRIMEMADLQGYLREDLSDPWTEPELNLNASKRKPFGIGQCAYVLSADGVSEIHFPYVPNMLYRITMTLHVLFIVLNWTFEREGTLSNQYQLYSINTRCEHASMGWGHSLNGEVFSTFRRWLSELTSERKDYIECKLGEILVEACVAFDEQERRAEMRKLWGPVCYGKINEEGRFILSCPGNACDIAIYPENDFQHDDYIQCSFSCHNLDSAAQQLSLLAGFATLCQFAQDDFEKT